MKTAEGWPIEAIVAAGAAASPCRPCPCSAAPSYQERLLGAGEASGPCTCPEIMAMVLRDCRKSGTKARWTARLSDTRVLLV